MIESQQKEKRCVLLISVQTAATTNKQLRSSQRSPTCLEKHMHAPSACDWQMRCLIFLSEVDFLCDYHPHDWCSEVTAFLLSSLSSVPLLLFGFSSLKYTFSAFYLLHHHVYGYVVGLSCFWCSVSDIPSHLRPWRSARWDLACQEPVCLFWSCCSGPSSYVLGFK